MSHVLTEHARKRCIKRKIREEWIVATLEHPARTENDLDDPTLAHALRPIPEKGFRVLRVIYSENSRLHDRVTGDRPRFSRALNRKQNSHLRVAVLFGIVPAKEVRNEHDDF